jgi:undecaprenyl diphosphate synthase
MKIGMKPAMLRLDPERIPKHVAIIMDGNGRWARKHRLSRINGHRKGADSVREILKACQEFGIKILTLFAFSTENWLRPKREINALMRLLEEYLDSELDELIKNRICLRVIGRIEDLPEGVRLRLYNAMEKTRDNSDFILNLALSYGGRAEIVRAFSRLLEKVNEGKISPSEISEVTVASCLDTAELPDPDLLIRTSGERRISNFLLWQIAYSEIYFTETLWPDFDRDEFIKALIDYQSRERRFGMTTEQLRKREVEHKKIP